MRAARALHGILAALLLLPATANGQAAKHTNPAPPSGLERRMRDFLRAVSVFPDSGEQPLSRFFPRRGEWTLVWIDTSSGTPVSTRRWAFAGGDTEEALASEPLCSVFPLAGVLDDASLAGSARRVRWRRIGRYRFVPTRRGERSPVYVEWRREGSRWVIAALAEESKEARRVVGRDLTEFMAEATGETRVALPLPDSIPLAVHRSWYASSLPLAGRGWHAVKYGLPRMLHAGDVVRVGWVDGVPAYAERRPFDYLYLPVDRQGTFQAYSISRPFCGVVM